MRLYKTYKTIIVRNVRIKACLIYNEYSYAALYRRFNFSTSTFFGTVLNLERGRSLARKATPHLIF